MVYNSLALISILCCLIRWPFNIGTKETTTRAPNKCHNFFNISNKFNAFFFFMYTQHMEC